MGSLTWVWPPVKEKENSEFKPIELYLKTELTSHPALGEVIKLIQTFMGLKFYHLSDSVVVSVASRFYGIGVTNHTPNLF